MKPDFVAATSKQGFIDVKGGRVWYEIAGQDKNIPLLTLHGGPGYPHDSIYSLSALGNDRLVIFYDQLGCGKSDRPSDISLWQTERFVEELVQVRKALHLEKIHIFGHSWGAMLAVDYALSNPGGLVSLILSSPPLSIPRWLLDMKTIRKKLPTKVQDVLHKHEVAGTTDSKEYQEADEIFAQNFICLIDPPPSDVEKALAGMGKEVYRTMWGPSESFMEGGNLIDYDRAEDLNKLKMPVLFTCGEHDEATPDSTRWYHSLTPGSELAIFPKSSHHAHLEEPDLYLKTVSDFIKQAENII